VKKKWAFDPEAVDVNEGALTLVVVRRSGKALVGSRIEVDEGVEEALRDICRKTLDRLRETEPAHFGPDVRIDRGEYLAVPDVSLILPSGVAPQSDIETDVELRELLGRASSLERLSARDLSSGFLLYAVVIGDDPSDRHAFVRKANPRSAVKPGRLVTAFGDRLQRIEQQLFVLDDHFDLVIGSGGLAALSQAVFEQLFRDTEIMMKRIPVYVKALTSTLVLSDDGADRLAEQCLAKPRLAKKLRALYENRLLRPGKITIANVRAEAKRQGVDPAKVIRGNKLVFDDDEPNVLLELLNEDLYTGGLSKTRYRAGSKTKRE